ncbi:DUF4446 family protein [Vallitaleaceae bacterium 9-2]
MSDIMTFFESMQVEILMIVTAVTLILFILLFITMINLSIFRNKYKKLNKGKTIQSYEEHIIKNKSDIEYLKQNEKELFNHIERIQEKAKDAYTKVYLHRYNAFERQGGEMSFVLVMLNRYNNGVILHNLHNSEYSYLYSKNVTNGMTKETLTQEEKDVLLKAMKQQ